MKEHSFSSIRFAVSLRCQRAENHPDKTGGRTEGVGRGLSLSLSLSSVKVVVSRTNEILPLREIGKWERDNGAGELTLSVRAAHSREGGQVTLHNSV